MNKWIAFTFLLCFILIPFRGVQAGVFGISPAEVVVDIDRSQESVPITLSLSRLNPKNDLPVKVSIEGDTSGIAHLIDGNSFILPLGMSTVKYVLLISPSKLENDEAYEFLVSFHNTESELSASGQQVIYGAKVKVQLVPKQQLAIEEGTSLISESSVASHLNVSREILFVGILISLFLVIRHLRRGGRFIYVNKKRVNRPLGFWEMLMVFCTSFIVASFFYTQFVREPFLLAIRTTDLPLNPVLQDDPLFFIVQESNGYVHNHIGDLHQELMGQWRVYSTKNGAFFLPNDAVALEQYAGDFLYFGNHDIRRMSQDQFPGEVRDVQLSFNSLYALFSGVIIEQNNETPFYCLTEFFEAFQVSCMRIGDGDINEINQFQFDQYKDNILYTQFQDHVSIYDIWRKTFSNVETGMQIERTRKQQSELFSGTNLQENDSFIISLNGKRFSTHQNTLFSIIDQNLYFESIENTSKGSVLINLLDLTHKTRAPIMEVQKGDQVYWLKSDTFFTSPNILVR